MQPVGLESQALLLGSNRLFAVRTSAVNHPGSTGMILLNAGMVASPGPFRMSVDIAEAAASMGVTTIRLDQSGKGESPARSEMAPAEAALADFDDACAYLHQLGITEVILAGLCSGAADALRIAANRDNIAGLILLDGIVGPDLRWRWDRLTDKVGVQIGRIKRAASLGLRGAFRKLEEQRSARAVAGSYEIVMDNRSWELAEFRQSYADVLARNVRILGMFSGTFYPYSHSGQLSGFLSGAADLSGLRELHFKDSDHLFSLDSHRERLVDTISKWIEAEFDTEAPPRSIAS